MALIRVSAGESCDCCGRTVAAVGTTRQWSSTPERGPRDSREVLCPSCHRSEAARAKDPDR